MKATRLGISSYCYPFAVGVVGFEPKKKLDAFGLVDKAVALGVSVLQICDNCPLDVLSRAELYRLADYAECSHVELEVGTRGIKTPHLLEYIEISEILRSKLLRVVIDSAGHEPKFDEIVELINAVLPVLEKKGIVLGIENHDRFKANVFADIVETFDSPNVGIVLDTVNSFACEENTTQVMDALAKHTVNYHIKDFKIERIKNLMGLQVIGTIAGKGFLNIPDGISRLMVEAKSDFSSILEFWMLPESTVDATIAKEDLWVRESIAYLKKVISQVTEIKK